MNADWESAIAFTLKMEGGAIAEVDPNDPGGLTKFGISQKAYPKLDITNLSLEDAKAIYRRDYWEACRCDELPSGFAIVVFDTAVNQGTGKAIRLLQTTLDLIADGIIGPDTIAAAKAAGPTLVKKYLAHRLAEYARLMASNKALLAFAVNWSYRVLRLADLIAAPLKVV